MFYGLLKKRMGHFGLGLQEEKSRRIGFGRFAQENSAKRGKKAETCREVVHAYIKENRHMSVDALVLLGFQCAKPAVKQDIFGSDACTPGGMDQFRHNICSLAARLQASPSGKGASVTGIPYTKKALIFRRRKQAVADRHKGVPVRPAKGEHPESGTALHGAVVENPCEQFRLFRAGAVKQAVVNNEDILTLFVRQGFHEAVDDAGRKKHSETLPVRPGVIEKTVDGVFGESLSKCTCFHLHIETPVGKHHTEQEAEDVHYRDTFFFSDITFKGQFSKVEPLHKFCGKIYRLCVVYLTWHRSPCCVIVFG